MNLLTDSLTTLKHFSPLQELGSRAGYLAFSTFLLLCSPYAITEDTADRYKEVDKNIRELHGVLANITAERSQSEKQLQRVEKEIASLGREIRDISQRFRQTRKDLRQLQRQETKLAGNRTVQQNAVTASIRAAYLAGPESDSSANIKVLLNQQDPARSARLQSYDRYINQQRTARIAEFNQTITSLQHVQLERQQLSQDLSKQQQSLSNRRSTLGNEQDKRKQLLASLDRKAQSGHQRLSRLKEERRELELIMNELQRRQQQPSGQPFAKVRGNLPWPVNGRIRYGFGQKNSDSALPLRGVYIDSRGGNEVRAVHDGKVVFSDWIRGYGMLLIVDHGNNYMTLYAHNATLLKQTGEQVLSGEAIATVGNSGGQPREGLYFEIRHNGTPVNPKRWLKKT